MKSWKSTPHHAEFEEKEYEFALYAELARSSRHIWTPGQVLEGHLGWEAAVRASSAYWKHVKRQPKPGVVLQGSVLALPPESHPLSAHGAVPSFRANLFIQAKRCTRYSRGPTALRKLKPGAKTPDPNKEIRAFDVYEKKRRGQVAIREQQEALERLHRRVQRGRARADVCYAAPVFDDRKTLFGEAAKANILATSNLPRAILLQGHNKWVYTDPGAQGWRCSDPEHVEEAGLDERLRKLLSDQGTEENDWTENLSALGDAVYDALLAQVPPGLHNDTVSSLRSAHREVEGTSHLLVAWILAVVASFGLLWFIAGPAKRVPE